MQQFDSRSLTDVTLAIPTNQQPVGGIPAPRRGMAFFLATLLIGACCFAGIFLTSAGRLVPSSAKVMAAESADLNNVLLDFTATWCRPCQQMSPMVSKLERQGFPIRKVDIDQEKALAQQFGVGTIPCFVLVANGREVNRITGVTDERQLRNLLMMLPKQNIDEPLLGKSPRGSGQGLSLIPTSPKSTDEKKLFSNLLPRFKDKEVKPAPFDPSEVVRGQNPIQEIAADGYARDPMSGSIRIRVKDGSKINFGSGTVIDSQPGRAVILTCGHIFRKLGKDAAVEVDVFTGTNSKPQLYIGQILKFDLKSDVGLLSIPSPQRLPTIKLAANPQVPAINEQVFSIGCGGGDRPTREDHRLTAINKFDGPDNVECTGAPKPGRSGGGLFFGSEQIGICILSNPEEKRGIYTGLKPVARLLNEAKLGHLIPTSLALEETLASAETSSDDARLGNPVTMNQDIGRSRDDEIARLFESEVRDMGGNSVPSSASSGDYVGAEIVCIVRPKGPGAFSRIVIVNQASSRFVDDLLHESNGPRQESMTALNSPAKDRLASLPRNAQALSGNSPRNDGKLPIHTVTMIKTDRPIETSFEPLRYRRKQK